jgi:hypothetical protein
MRRLGFDPSAVALTAGGRNRFLFRMRKPRNAGIAAYRVEGE